MNRSETVTDGLSPPESSNPLVSVITAVRNGAAHIAQTIESVIAQDYPCVEHIVIDGGSTDGTQEIVERYRGRIAYFVSEKDRGISDAWNKGIRASRGRYVAFLNADDFYLPTFIRRSVAATSGTIDEILYGATLIVNERSEPESMVDSGFRPDRVASGFGFRHPSCLARRELFDRVGMFDENVRIACDTDFLLRCLKHGAAFRRTKGVVCMRRGGLSDRHWRIAALEHLSRAALHGFVEPRRLWLHRLLVPLRAVNRRLGLMRAVRWAKTQFYFVGLRAINSLHGLLPFFARPLLYRLCGYRVHHSATVQGGVRFFHAGNLSIGGNTVVNRGTYLDNRAGITIGSRVSIAHDVKIYSLGHEIHDDLFATKGRPVVIGDGVVIFAGAMIMPGVRLGDGCVVMAGAVVTSDVPKLQIVGGNPAQALGQRDSCPAYLLKRRFWFAH